MVKGKLIACIMIPCSKLVLPKMTEQQALQRIILSNSPCTKFCAEAMNVGQKSLCVLSLLPAWHCPEVDTRWTHEYVILNFARSWPRTWSTSNQQLKEVQCLQKVTRWHSKHTRMQHEDVKFYLVVYPQATRRPHDGYTTSYWEYDAFELGHEGVA